MWNLYSISSELPEESQGVFNNADMDVFKHFLWQTEVNCRLASLFGDYGDLPLPVSTFLLFYNIN